MPGADGLALVGQDGLVPDQQYYIRPGDDLDIKFFYTQELNDTAVVRPDGYISLQLVDDVKVAGLTPQQVDDLLTEKYAKHLKDPAISVIVRSFKGFRAYVGGEVAVPQVVSLESGMSVMQAIYRVGGTLPTANMESIVLIRKGSQGEPIPYHLDLSDEAIAAGRPDLQVALTPSDIVYIPRSPIANANKWVQQYITDLVLFKGVQLGFGVNYIIDRDGDGDN
ncbi:polysaccharide biosynthesis/export family protein [Pseudomonas sp. Gutcm_11s]|uniref:polysaccharide biosynthesis/export family protein n=1 Tax=Pseudomonas sp. Gutcm_11s TaxID=3026088 RepID=UPI002360954C|nr:polysaccharide biosynthesis/export family protein [Pseudomonas sp. Gutcm_11s]MDD0841195.1 polysaccharide biosynthesis/export family protein [Pseudomonas sp. Gutcm_11s]